MDFREMAWLFIYTNTETESGLSLKPFIILEDIFFHGLQWSFNYLKKKSYFFIAAFGRFSEFDPLKVTNSGVT